MTTIVATHAEMAADSCTSWESDFVITGDKIEIVNRQLVGCAGHTPDIMKFLRWLKNPTPELPEFGNGDDEGFTAVVVNKDGLFLYANSVDPMPVREPFIAIGSGGMAAKAAMLCGRSPVSAVEIALRCDKNSRGPIQRVTLKQAMKRKN